MLTLSSCISSPSTHGDLVNLPTINHSSRWQHTGQTPCPGLQTWPTHSLTTLTLSSCISSPSTHADLVNIFPQSINLANGSIQDRRHLRSWFTHPAHPSHFDMQDFMMRMRVVFQACCQMFGPAKGTVLACEVSSDLGVWLYQASVY